MTEDTWAAELTQQVPRLRRYARALTQQRDIADDLVQDCVERAWSRRHLWTPGTSLRAWLFTMMHHIFLNQIRRTRSRPEHVSIDDAEPAGASEDPMLLHDLERCLASLSPEHREVLLLAGLEQMSYQEIATILDLPTGTVMSRLARARERMRELMTNKSAFLVRVK